MTHRVTCHAKNRPPLQEAAFLPLPLGAVLPRGWLLDQCRVQADGLTGHIEEFWPDLGPNNMWLGGETEGWERGPYYLDGLVPLAHLLNDAGLIARAQRWIDSILSMQDASGWIGPVHAPDRRPYDHWPVAIVLKVLTQHQEATGDPRAIPAIQGFCRWLRNNLADKPLFDWGRYRWADLVLSIHWLYNRTGERWLLDVAATVAAQGFDWLAHFAEFRYREKVPKAETTPATHGVNNAMGLKSGGVWWRQTGDPAQRDMAARAVEMLDRYHGQVTGMFTCDEHLAGLSPTQGTELCTVVEYMFSLEELIGVLGEPALCDRLERIAYNALPAAFTSDMWAHQYDQQVNQVLCSVAKRAWEVNFDDANIFGLEPNYGCCTANMHQGWPKLVKSLWMATPDDGLAAVAYGPSEVVAHVTGGARVRIVEETGYPFDGEVSLRLGMAAPVRFPLVLRVPNWAGGASVRVGGEVVPNVRPGAFVRLDRDWHNGDEVSLDFGRMAVRIEGRPGGAISVLRGPLVFALKMGERFEVIKGAPPQADYAVHPTTPWNYGLVTIDAGSGIREGEMRPLSSVLWSQAAAPVTLIATAKRIPEWGLVDNSAGATPQSGASSNAPLEEVELIPYGCTHLRIAEFPVVVTAPHPRSLSLNEGEG